MKNIIGGLIKFIAGQPTVSATSSSSEKPAIVLRAGPPARPVSALVDGDYKHLEREWRRFADRLKSSEELLKECRYEPFLELNHQGSFQYFLRPLAEDDELFLLPKPFELISSDELLFPRPLPDFPEVPSPPEVRLSDKSYPEWYRKQFLDREIDRRTKLLERAVAFERDLESLKVRYEAARQAATAEGEALRTQIQNGDSAAQLRLLEIANGRNYLPRFLQREFSAVVDKDAGIAAIQFEFPDYRDKSLIVGYTSGGKEKFASAAQKKRLVRQCLYSLIVRAAYLGANILGKYGCTSVVVNVNQTWFDSATGQPKQGIIASLQAQVDYLVKLDLAKLDAEACFRHLKGLITPSLENVSPIRPILVLDKEDERFVPSRAVEEGLDVEANLAAIPWEDFEHLVAQLFEWEFARNGIEVKVTRTSRDRGVDAVLFDPDPLRGGKYVLQAKRYTRTVDVSAVRDLYGTVMNEGANRGILITTSSYGPDAYEFAKDKQISLVDGANLLHMLQKHGRRFRIDLEEARRINEGET